MNFNIVEGPHIHGYTDHFHSQWLLLNIGMKIEVCRVDYAMIMRISESGHIEYEKVQKWARETAFPFSLYFQHPLQIIKKVSPRPIL